MTDWIDDLPHGIREFVDQLRALPDFPLKLANFARVLHERERQKEKVAENLARRAWLLAPRDSKVRLAAAWALRRSIPPWHFPMVHDLRRNSAYEETLRRLITPETTVLEIGTGTGILAMLAARAGAKHVYTCEMEELIAEAARANVERNGFSGCVTVIAKKSTDLVVGEDLPARAGLLVSDHVGPSLLGYDILPVVEDAKARLLTPEAVIVPARGAIRGVLVGGPRWADRCRMGEVSGLDLSAFDRLAPLTVTLPRDGCSLDDALSDETELFRVDFMAQSHFPEEEKVVTLKARRNGIADGFLQWLWLGFSDGVELDYKPPAGSTWRNPILHVFPEPLRVRADDTVRLRVEHDRRSIVIWPV